MEEIHVDTHKDEKVLRGVDYDLVKTWNEFCIRVDCLVELSPQEPDESHKGADRDYINCVVVGNVGQMVGLRFGGTELSVFEQVLDKLLEIAELTPVYDAKSHCIRGQLRETLTMFMRNWIGAIGGLLVWILLDETFWIWISL